MNSIDRATILENDTDIESMHDETTCSNLNQTSRGTMEDDKVDTHFVAFIASTTDYYK